MRVDNPGIAHIAGCDDAAICYHQPPASFERQCRPCLTGNRRLVAAGTSKKCLVLGPGRRHNGQFYFCDAVFYAINRIFISGGVRQAAEESNLADTDPGDVYGNSSGHIPDALSGYRCAFYQWSGCAISRESKFRDHTKCVIKFDLSLTGLCADG